MTTDYGRVIDYRTGEDIRAATREEWERSVAQARKDGGAGVVTVDGRPCYVQGGPDSHDQVEVEG